MLLFLTSEIIRRATPREIERSLQKREHESKTKKREKKKGKEKERQKQREEKVKDSDSEKKKRASDATSRLDGKWKCWPCLLWLAPVANTM